MKTRYIVLIVMMILVGFIIWSVADTVCKPCIKPPDAPENYYCILICTPEPRWYGWFR